MRTRFSFLTLFAVGSTLTLVAAACGSSSGGNGFGDNGGGDNGGDGSAGDDASTNPLFDGNIQQGQEGGDATYSNDAYFAMDPPYMICAPDGAVGIDAAPPGGTPTCPDDKNLPGCACPTVGATAACWTGLRAQRNVGVCKDGTTTCTMTGETSQAWGPCVGEVTPTPGATMGADACKCFSSGTWAIANLSPCFYSSGTTTAGASSTLPPASAGAAPTCYATPPPALPNMDWSSDTLTADCVGTFNLCYTLKAGDGAHPQPTDCVVTQVCTTAYYPVAGQVTPFPALPAWTTTTAAQNACAAQAAGTASSTTATAYAELSVTGTSELCEAIGDVNDAGMQTPFVFDTVTYCPSSCNVANPPPSCANCMTGGSGMFN